MEPIQKHKIEQLKKLIIECVDILDSMNDATYDIANDFNDPNHGRYSDLVEYAQHLSSPTLYHH